MQSNHQTQFHGNSLKIIRHKGVCQKMDISSSQLFDICAKGDFPKPFQLVPGGRAVGWLEHQVDQWILERKAASEKEAT